MKIALKRVLNEIEVAEWKANGKMQWSVKLLFVFGLATCLHAVRVVEKEYHNGASSSIVSNN